MGRWEHKTVGEINTYKGKSVNPLNAPNVTFELYSVPSWDSNYPEIIKGAEIGSIKQTVEKGDVLLCKINPRINRVWIVEEYTKSPLIASSEWIVIRNTDINSRYLSRYFQSPIFRDMMVSEQSGIGGSLTRAQPKRVSNYPVPLPPLSVQRQIADVLDLISALIQKRKAQIEKLDLLVKSQFTKMFGDIPKANYVTIASVCSIITDGTHQPPKFLSTGIPFLFVSNIASNEIKYDTDKFISEETYAELIKRTPIEIGDILLSTVGSYGHPAVVKTNQRFCFQRHIAYLKPRHKLVDSNFLYGALLSPVTQMQIEAQVKGVAQKTLNLSEIKKITIPLPTVDEQRFFSIFIRQVEANKRLLQQSLTKLEQNYKSLMQKCFRGELF